MSRNSIIPFCASTTSGVSVRTTMPSRSTTVEQPAWSFGIFLPPTSISTRHMRHWPTIDRRGW